LADIITIIGDSEADPYLIIGVLVEGAVHTLQSRIPGERQIETASGMLKLVADRLRDTGILPGV
jgi:hypothetical protein